MELDLELIQKVGFGGALLLLVWKVGWAIVAALKALTAAVNAHTATDLAHHADVKQSIVALSTKVDGLVTVREAVQEVVDEVSGVHETTQDWKPKTPPYGIRKPTRGQ